ncbi:MAG: ABC transporter permease [Schwartzia sp.]|nr:ABC transporter permease [Schwartzia sp. (in: firmicutes)]MBR1886099.1 ABC transporter permease [Schwartzia sp. (in: firmicutes)]
MNALFSMFLSEFRALFTVHRRGAAALAFLPMAYLLLFGGLFAKNAVNEAAIGVCDLDGSAESRRLIRALDDADALSVRLVGTLGETETAYRRGDILAYAVIPQDYAENLRRGVPVSVEVVANNANTVLGNTAMNGFQAVVDTIGAERAAENRIARGVPSEAAGALAAPVQLSLRSLYNSTGGYNDFFTSVLLLHALQIAAVFTVAPMMALEKCRPQENSRPLCRLFAKAFALSAWLTLSLLFSLLCGIVLLGMTCRAPLLPLAFLGFSFAFAMTAFAFAVGAWVRKPSSTISYTLFYIMPSVLFSGAVWPRASMDGVSRFLSWVMPIGYAAIDFRELLVRGDAPTLGEDCAILVAIGLAFLAFARFGLLRKEAARNARSLGTGTFPAAG